MVGRFLLCCHRYPLSEESIKNTSQKNKKKKIKKNSKKGVDKGSGFWYYIGALGERQEKIKTYERTSGEAKKSQKTS